MKKHKCKWERVGVYSEPTTYAAGSLSTQFKNAYFMFIWCNGCLKLKRIDPS